MYIKLHWSNRIALYVLGSYPLDKAASDWQKVNNGQSTELTAQRLTSDVTD